MKKVLFIDRDGTLINEAPPTYQIDSLEKLVFYPGVFTWLGRIERELDFELVMVTNQDGLGTDSFPETDFWPIQSLVINTLAGEGIHFKEILIDRSLPTENKNTRKPGTGMLTKYLNNTDYDMAGSYVIGDRESDIELATNLGSKSLLIGEQLSWKQIYEILSARKVSHRRKTNETDIDIEMNLDGRGLSEISTGLKFFDHMLEQLAKHSGIDLKITTKGDLQIDEHHSIEDTAIALGEALGIALSDKKGIARYGFTLPMDDSLAQVAIDLGGRSWLVWDADFKREKIGDMPTEMFYHFFKSFSDAAKCNLNIKVEGDNEHHKIESIFKAFAKTLGQAVKRDGENSNIPTTKGVL